jgi:hypothetical protein
MTVRGGVTEQGSGDFVLGCTILEAHLNSIFLGFLEIKINSLCFLYVFGYGLDDRGVGVRVPSMVKNFHVSISSRPVLGSTHLPIQWVQGALSPGVKRQGREADNSPPRSAEVKKTWIYISISPYVLMA